MKKLVRRCGHDKAAHGSLYARPLCIGYIFDSFCDCKCFASDNLELLEHLVDEHDSNINAR